MLAEIAPAPSQEKPKSARPARVVVGQAFGADAVNEAVAPIQQQVIETLGLGALASKPIDEMA
jgi:hypothetical protein